MSDKWSEQIFDSMLEEVLSGKHPPDLTERIVDAWKRESAVASTKLSSADSAVALASKSHARDNSVAKIALARPRYRKSHRRKTWLAPLLSVAASGLLVVASWQFWQHTARQHAAILVTERQPRLEIAQKEIAQRSTIKDNGPTVVAPRSEPKTVLPSTIASNHIETQKNDEIRLDSPSLLTDKVQGPSNQGPNNQGPSPAPSALAKKSFNATALTDKQIVALIDSQLQTLWKRLDIAPTSALNRAELIKKLSLALTGQANSAELTPSQMAMNRADQRIQIVQTLTESPSFAQYWADRFASRWLAGTSAADATTEGGKSLRSMLGREITQHTPLNKVVASLIHPDALGSKSASTMSDIFLTSLAANDNRRLATRVGKNLLDEGIGCVQCHQSLAGHSEQKVQQEEFWSLVACLSGLRGSNSGAGQLRSLIDTQAELFANNGQPNVFFELPDGRVQSASASLPNGQPWNSVAEATSPRQALASWLVESPQIDRAIVNQVWHIVFGRPLVPQVTVLDETGLQEREELLHALALQLRAHEHRLSKLAGWLVQSEAFSRQPLAVDRQKWLNANDSDFEKWSTMESAFASAGTLGKSIEAKSLDSSLAAVLRWNGMVAAQDRSKSLAQPADMGTAKKGKKKTAQKQAESAPSAGYLVHASWHTPAQREFIGRIARSSKLSWRDQVQHVVGLTGDYALSQSVEKLANELLAESSKNVESALLQLLWAVRNSDAS